MALDRQSLASLLLARLVERFSDFACGATPESPRSSRQLPSSSCCRLLLSRSHFGRCLVLVTAGCQLMSRVWQPLSASRSAFLFSSELSLPASDFSRDQKLRAKIENSLRQSGDVHFC